MASLIEDLIGVLEEETGCYNLLLEVANNKKDVIINWGFARPTGTDETRARTGWATFAS